ncbi:MAG: helicase-associated domain-containing protein [Phycisphaeraceae bacterium]|nr:helicase-associated domain-containing protein [Phycisphaeraceae bacterium]
MRHLNIDWAAFIGKLQTWSSLARESQSALLQLKPNQYLRRDTFDHDDLRRLLDEGLLALSADEKRVRLHPDSNEFSRGIRAMRRHRFVDASDERSLAAYASDHFTVAERFAMLHDSQVHRGYYGSENYQLVTQHRWLKHVVELPSLTAAQEWEQGRMPDQPTSDRFEDGSPYFQDQLLFDATRRLLKAAATWAEPVPLTELAGHVPDVEPGLLHRAIMPAVRYLLLFPWLEGDDALPVISIWPQISYLLHRPEPKPPEPVEPCETFHAPILIEDMMTVLVTAAAEPLRVLANGGGLYAKDLDRIAESAIALPGWLANAADADVALPDPHDSHDSRDSVRISIKGRLAVAAQTCLNHKLLQPCKAHKDRVQLQATDAAHHWLAMDMYERIRGMIHPWRERPRQKDGAKARARTLLLHDIHVGLDASWHDDDQRFSSWTPSRLRWAAGPDIEKIDWRAAFADLLADADGAFVPLEDLLEYHSRVNNPLLGRRKQGSYGPTPRLDFYGQRNVNETYLEKMWVDQAEGLIAERLVPLGAIELGWLGKKLAIRLHPIGRYMLGLAEDFDYKAQPEGSVVIQPNFEVTFLGPAPRAEAMIGRLAERTGSRIGTMFRITRASILAAAAAGVTADEALSDLTSVSSKPVPDNVHREVRGWFSATRRVRMRQAWLIDAPDAHTAAQIVAAVGKNASQMTSTMIEITAPKQDHATLIRKLKQSGIFVQ